MTVLPIHNHGLNASRLILGCMGFGGGWSRDPILTEHVKQAHEAVETALASGIHMFDHADIYAYGKAETVFGQVLQEKPELREKMIIQSKLGIRFPDEAGGIPARYDFSKAYILESVDGILSRLGIDYLDILLLHRPDALMDAREVGQAFHHLKASGKVRYFGVSNMSAGQIRLLQTHCSEKLVVNQLELSLHKIGWLETGIHVNQDAAKNNIFPEGTLEYCQLENIQLQAWGSLAKGLFSGASLENTSESVKNTAQLVKRLAEEKQTSPEAIVLAWLMKHPAAIQPVIGTTAPSRIRACAEAENIVLSRDEWYTLYVSSRGVGLP
ncbi:aldo/keto reductase [Paenibacillus oralis]|uniref:Aldo/keto reductase n=1 Tax=Paenibacillus oralis TaxID=2490856 RepID=A0A3P3U0X9_9BACL|nr:aldo/keto reductase [Paenibacillus oralis]RRJ64011.1 aldo/keto reductase [Paenibacillus oralis]